MKYFVSVLSLKHLQNKQANKQTKNSLRAILKIEVIVEIRENFKDYLA